VVVAGALMDRAIFKARVAKFTGYAFEIAPLRVKIKTKKAINKCAHQSITRRHSAGRKRDMSHTARKSPISSMGGPETVFLSLAAAFLRKVFFWEE